MYKNRIILINDVILKHKENYATNKSKRLITILL